MEGNSKRITRQPIPASPLTIAAVNGLSIVAPAPWASSTVTGAASGPPYYRVDVTHWESLRHEDLRNHISRVGVLLQRAEGLNLWDLWSAARAGGGAHRPGALPVSPRIHHRGQFCPGVSPPY